MAIRTSGARWQRDCAYRTEAAVINRRQGKTTAGRVTVSATLASYGSMDI